MDFEGWNGLYWVSLTGVDLGTVTDIDGNQYKTIRIGDQTWMGENLRTARYRNGDDVPQITGAPEWTSLEFGAWCWYDNMSQYETPYGKLYYWFATVDGRGLCPTGWHVPDDDNFDLPVYSVEENALRTIEYDTHTYNFNFRRQYRRLPSKVYPKGVQGQGAAVTSPLPSRRKIFLLLQFFIDHSCYF